MNTYPRPPYCGDVHGEYHCTRTPGHDGLHVWTGAATTITWDET